jgi:hypothetical protein
MKRDTVEVLVILLVLAAGMWFFVIPWMQPWKEYGKFPRANAEISNMELAITKVLSDAGRSSLRDLVAPKVFDEACVAYARQHNLNAFEASVALYTRSTYALLRHGRNALTIPVGRNDEVLDHVQRVLNPEVVNSLDTLYMEIEDDPWGNRYQFFWGQWPEKMGLVPLRRLLMPGGSSGLSADQFIDGYGPDGDALTVSILDNPSVKQGFPAPRHFDVYIWSFGKNGVPDQPRYDPTHEYAPPARQHYREDARDEYLGGGDDINNWDRDQTFMRLYN